MGAMPTTRGSTAAVVHVVQPRFDAPVTKNFSTLFMPPCSVAENAVIASSARTAALVIGRRVGQRSSPVRRNLSQQNAMMSSSLRGVPSPVNTSGWLGTFDNSATTDFAASAIIVRFPSGFSGAGRSLLPPPIMSKATEFSTLSGVSTLSQCFHTGLSTSFSVSHCCEVSSMTVNFPPATADWLTTFHAKHSSFTAT